MGRTEALIAVLPALFPFALWVLAEFVHSQWCNGWCLTCTHGCSVSGMDASWLLVLGLIYSPYLLAITAPLSLLQLLALLVMKRRT